MKNNLVQTKVNVQGSTIKVLRIDGYEYISLTDLAKTQNDESPADVVKNWMRNKETLSVLGVCLYHFYWVPHVSDTNDICLTYFT